MSFFSRLTARVCEADSLLCVGLDPHLADLTSPTVEAAQEFCHELIDSTLDFAAAYKPNSAFFEAFGPAGISVLQQVISTIPKSIPVILDAKRGDIASSAEGYVTAIFHQMGAQAVTISPYLGHDAVEPFLRDPDKGAFLLCKTSNPGSEELQDLRVIEPGNNNVDTFDHLLYERVALLAQEWNENDNLGLVVGATQPDAIKKVRALVPEMWILAPGVGLQGGDLRQALSAGLRSDGMGMLISISRGISQATAPRQAAAEIRNKINEIRINIPSVSKKAGQREQLSETPTDYGRLANDLLEAGCVKFGEFTLKSGMISPIYIDLRQLVSYPQLLRRAAQAYLRILSILTFDRLVALPYAALPIATAISLQSGWPMIYPRKEVKNYGTKSEIEGLFNAGERVVIIDDLATTGSSKFESIEKLISAGLKITDIVVLIDRQSGAAEALSTAGYKLHSVVTLSNLLDYYEKYNKVPAEQIENARRFIDSSK